MIIQSSIISLNSVQASCKESVEIKTISEQNDCLLPETLPIKISDCIHINVENQIFYYYT